MPFAAALRDSLETRQAQFPTELSSGESLEQVLNRHLATVEAMADGELITSILLLSTDGMRLSHGAAPRLPRSYREAIDGAEIGPSAGSCGTAAFWGRPVYVSDIATDPLWAKYRHIALPHGLRSCWSTPIRDPDDAVIGTFAIYRPTIGKPTEDEVEAIDMISTHVAQAIIMARTIQDTEPVAPVSPKFQTSTSLSKPPADPRARLLHLAARLKSRATDLHRLADSAETQEAAQAYRNAGELSEQLVEAIQWQFDARRLQGDRRD